MKKRPYKQQRNFAPIAAITELFFCILALTMNVSFQRWKNCENQLLRHIFRLNVMLSSLAWHVTSSVLVEVIHITNCFICFSIHKHLVRKVVLYATFNYISICNLSRKNTLNFLIKSVLSRVPVMKKCDLGSTGGGSIGLCLW